MVVGQFDRPQILMDAAGHLVDRHAVGRNGIPDADEPDPDIAANADRRIVRPELVADPLVWTFQLKMLVALAAIGAVGRTGKTVKLGFVVSPDEPLAVDHSHHDADGEGAAAEAKAEQFVIGVAIIPAGKLVERDDVAAEAKTERAAEQRERLE